MALFHRILVPYDGSETSTKALVAALQLARNTGGRVRVLHALDELAYLSGIEYPVDVLREARAWAAMVLDRAAAEAKAAGVEHDTVLVDTPGQRLGASVADAAREWKADLVVVGTHGRRGVSRMLLGSGAEQIIRLAVTPVLVVRGDDTPPSPERTSP
jgi:nucleotide-binding universal stress UspA family protein